MHTLYTINIFCTLFLIPFSIEAQQTGLQARWWQKGTMFLRGQKEALSKVVRSALRRPSLVGALATTAAGAAATYATTKTAKAETIFIAYDQDGNARPLTPQEHEKTYEAKLSSQFPTASCYEGYDPNANETEVIQKKISTTLPYVTVVDVPKTLYHLSALNLIASDMITLEKRVDVEKTEDFCRLNRDKKLEMADLKVNNDIIDRIKNLKSSPVSRIKKWFGWSHSEKSEISNLSVNDFHLIAHSIIPDLSKKRPHNQLQNNMDIIDKAIDVEIDARKKNEFVLWRGESKAKEFSLKEKTKQEQYQAASSKPISYGASLLGGCKTNPSACAYNYVVGEFGDSDTPPVGYALAISKEDYIHGPTGNMWHIPPLSAIAELTHEGIWWHPRTKVPESWRMSQTPSEFRMAGWKYQKKRTVSNMFQKIHKDMIPLTPQAEIVKQKMNSNSERYQEE